MFHFDWQRRTTFLRALSKYVTTSWSTKHFNEKIGEGLIHFWIVLIPKRRVGKISEEDSQTVAVVMTWKLLPEWVSHAIHLSNNIDNDDFSFSLCVKKKWSGLFRRAFVRIFCGWVTFSELFLITVAFCSIARWPVKAKKLGSHSLLLTRS